MKTTNFTVTLIRETSCSRGWLRLVVQLIFGVITVASFILIVHMAMQRPPKPKNIDCSITMCRVQCMYSLYNEEQIASAVVDAVHQCPTVQLSINGAVFENNAMPKYWLEKLPAHIETLEIVGGNLEHIPPNAFMSPMGGRLKYLTFEDIKISYWFSDTFIGLSNLKELNIRHCCILNIDKNALRAVSSTLQRVTVVESGRWDPLKVTGSTTLTQVNIVNLSNNIFGNIIGPDSFTGLQFCEELYLNSCQITSIGSGTFDPLVNIKMIHLNDNFLVHISPGLFSKIININDAAPRPRVNVQNNLLNCDCQQKELLALSDKRLLLVDPLCYHPEDMRGEPFSTLEDYCKNVSNNDQVFKQNDINSRVTFTAEEQDCLFSTQPTNSTLHLISPIPALTCNFNTINKFTKNQKSSSTTKTFEGFSWLQASILVSVDRFSVVKVGSPSFVDGLGIVWYKSTCPNEVYCANTIPNALRVYDTHPDTQYTFCPINLRSKIVDSDSCLNYSFSEIEIEHITRIMNASVIGIAILCLSIGAICVYVIIRRYPYVLKGSKRVLFVKHRMVDALVLPPKVPLRNSLSRNEMSRLGDDKKVFTVSDDCNLLYPGSFVRSNSVRSDKSCTPTYISALQPTEAQLAEWRIRHHFDQSLSLTSISSEQFMSTWNWTCENKNSLESSGNSIVYESLK